MASRITTLLIAAVIALAAWLCFVLWSTAPFQDCLASEIEAYKAAEEAGKNSPESVFSLLVINARADTVCAGNVLYEYRDATTALATVFIALFTLTLWLSTKRLWQEAKDTSNRQAWEMQNSLRIANDAAWAADRTANAASRAASAATRNAATAEAALLTVQRAYVLFDFFEVSQPTDLGDLSVVLIPTWKNAGLTPAKNAIAHVNTDMFDAELIDDFEFPDFGNKDPIPFAIAANAPFHAATLTIAGERVTAMMRGEKRIYIWGWVDYNDIFNGTDRHRTEMCYEMVRMVRGQDAAPGQRQQSGVRFMLYKKHNNTDEGCMKKPQPYPS